VTPQIDWIALTVFLLFFLLVTILGFLAARWKVADLNLLHEWGLGGNRFGTIITWFLLGGDFYTAYTMIAVPALVYAVGAAGFFALPYTIIVYPFVFAIMPRVWQKCRANGYLTAADLVRGEHRQIWLATAVAFTGLLATMPYIALQLVGMRVAIQALGFTGDLPLAIAFVILALYTYSSGLRAPAMIAFVKDVMIYAVVLAAVVIVPVKLGGYGYIFQAADQAFTAKGGATGLLLHPAQMLPFASLALGSALAAFMYPHTLTGVLSSRSFETIRRNAILLPAYTVLLGLIALLGFMAIAAGIRTKDTSTVVPLLILKIFPNWFVGFSFAAITIGALVPAAIMSIGAANLFTRNIWGTFINDQLSARAEARIAKLTSLAVKLGALAFIVFLPTEYAIDLQLMGGIWILQTLPAVISAVCPIPFRISGRGLLAGWVTGMVLGTWLTFGTGLKPLVVLPVLQQTYTIYIGLVALVANLAITWVGSLLAPERGVAG